VVVKAFEDIPAYGWYNSSKLQNKIQKDERRMRIKRWPFIASVK
jgi:hypothetical protein